MLGVLFFYFFMYFCVLCNFQEEKGVYADTVKRETQALELYVLLIIVLTMVELNYQCLLICCEISL